MSRQVSIFDPKIRLDLALRARRVATGISTQVDLIADGCTACHPASARSDSLRSEAPLKGKLSHPLARDAPNVVAPNTMTGQPARLELQRCGMSFRASAAGRGRRFLLVGRPATHSPRIPGTCFGA